MFLRLQLVSFRKVHDLCWGLLIFCVILCLLKFRLYSVWDLPLFLRLQLVSFRKVHDLCWGLLIFCVVVYYLSYFWNFGYILSGICLCFYGCSWFHSEKCMTYVGDY